MKNVFYFFFAVAFGLVLSFSGVCDYDRIQAMFLFEEPDLFLMMGTAVLLTAPGLWLLKRYGKTAAGTPLTIPNKALHRGNVIGGALFGIGWALTGMCPGPILVNIGAGKIYALAAFGGSLAGAYLLGALYPALTKPLGLPPSGK